MKFLKDTIGVQRIFVAVFIVYYLFRLEPYTWHFSEKLLFWPSSLIPLDAVWIHQNFLLILFTWLFAGLVYIVRPNNWAGVFFFLLSYAYVGRLNSYVFIQRFDFAPMIFLMLTLLLPANVSASERKLKKIIISLGKIVWVLLFFSGAVEKLKAVGFNWADSQIIRNFIFAENALQGELICSNPSRVSFLNWVQESKTLLISMGYGALFLELFYPLILFSKRLVPYFLVSTLVFQVAVDYVLVTPYYSYWLGLMFWMISSTEVEDEQITIS